MNAVNVGVGDFRNIVSPVFPVVAVAALLNNLGVQGTFYFAYLKLKFSLVLAAFVGYVANGTTTTRFARLALLLTWAFAFTGRSEERRVGKECRLRGSQY